MARHPRDIPVDPFAPDPEASTGTLDALALARVLRARGDTVAAARLLDAALAWPALQVPPTTALAAQAGWIHLERADLYGDAGDLHAADRHGLAALDGFQRGDERAGAAAACVLLGDLDWQGGNPRAATSWWARARALADAAGATPIAARALLGLALHELGAGEAPVAEALIRAAQDRADHDLAMALDPQDPDALEQARLRTQAVRASLAVMRAQAAIGRRNWPEARLFLAGAAEAARALALPGLHLDALRLDALLARRSGDPAAAVEILLAAVRIAREQGVERMAWLLESELALALLDAGRWAEAAGWHEREPPPQWAEQPALRAARLEVFAVLAASGGRQDAAAEALHEAVELREQLGDRPAAARDRLLAARTALAAGRLDAARRIALLVQGDAQREGQGEWGVEAALVLAGVAVAAQDLTAVDLAMTAVAEARRTGSVPQALAALDLHVAALLQQDDVALARKVAREAVGAADTQPSLALQARAVAREAQVLLRLGEPSLAARRAVEAGQLAKRGSDPAASASAAMTGGRALVALGRLDEARFALDQSRATALAHHRRDLAAEASFELGNALLAAREGADATAAFEQALTDALAAGLQPLSIRAQRGLAAAARVRGDSTAVRYHLEAALQAAEADGRDDERVAVLTDWALADLEGGDLAAAHARLASLGPPSALANRLSPATRGDARALLGRICAQQRDFAGAAPLLHAAIADLRTAAEPRSLGAALLLAGQVEGALGHGEACGAMLGEALTITARHGLPEQVVVRQVIERLRAQAESVDAKSM